MEGLTSSSVLSLKCTVCKKECESYADWITHLLENEHQNLARKECQKWDESARTCVIIAYADFPLITLGRKIVQVFGCLSRGRFVTDFVTWEHRPRVAFVQFESRKKLWEVICKTGRMSQLKIQNQRIQVKKAIDVMELEWNEFFPTKQEPMMSPIQIKDPSVQTETPYVSNPCHKRKFDCIDIGVDNQRHSSNHEERITNHLPCPIKTLSQNDSSNNISTQSKEGTTIPEPLPPSLQIASQEKNLTPMQPQEMSPLKRDHCSNAGKGKTDNHAAPLPPLSNEDISKNNLKNSTKNQTVLPISFQKNCSNNFIPKNGTISHLPSPRSKKNSSRSPNLEKEQSKKKTTCNTTAKTGNVKERTKRLPSLLELFGEKPQRLDPNPNKTKRQRLLSDVQTISTTPNSFQTQYKEICDEIMIPDLEYINLKNPGSNKLLMFLDTQGIWEEDWILENTDASQSQNIPFVIPDLRNPIAKFWTKLKLQKLSDMKMITQDFLPELNSFGMEFYYEATDLSVILATRQHFILEVQTCRLLKYITAFDPRTIPVMAIVKYWAHVNGVISLISPKTTDHDQVALSSLLSQAVSLDWLVIVFLSSRRFIPTVRQILERPHKKLIMFKQDIGFHADMAFAKAWASKRGLPEVDSEDFIKSVLALVQEFFKFCSQLPSTSYVLNPKDGEIIKSEQFSRSLPYIHAKGAAVLTKLSKEELTAIKNGNAQVEKSFVSMLHPLCLDHMLVFDKSTFYGESMSVIKNTAKKLQNVTFYGSNDNWHVDLRSLLLLSD